MIPEWLQKLLTEGLTIPVKLVITPEIDPKSLELLKSLADQRSATQTEIKLDSVKLDEIISQNFTDEMKTEEQEEETNFTRNVSERSTLNTNSIKETEKCNDAQCCTSEKEDGAKLRHPPINTDFAERRKLNKLKYDRSGNVVKCPQCGSDSIIKKGKQAVGDSTEQRFSCLDCGHCFFAGIITYRSLPAEKWIKLTDKLEWQEYEGRIVIHYSDSIVLTSWHEIESLSKLSEDNARNEILNLYNKNSQKRTAIRTFLKAFIDGVACKVTEVPKPDVLVNGKKFWPIPGFPDVVYQESGKDVLILKFNDVQIETTWPEVIGLSQYTGDELNKKIYLVCDGEFNKRVALKEFIKAYRDERVRDPDAFCRPVLAAANTRPDENFGKIEGTLEAVE